MKICTVRRLTGFSLIEVLIAVVVMSVGLLALANLQVKLLRASAETKAQSVATSLAKERLEDIRGFTSIDGTGGYLSLTDSTGSYTDSSGSLGGQSYTLTTTVKRYAYDASDSSFKEITTSDTAALTGTYTTQNEFKKISVSVNWTDANGDPYSVVMDDAIGAVTPSNTGRVVRTSNKSGSRGPEVLITNPGNVTGVIPIAIGNGSDTAATNPRPEVSTGVSRETSYDIFTYAALTDSSGNAKAQSQVETRIVGCKCNHTTKITTQANYRPTYWDGTRYVPPEEADGSSLAGVASLDSGDPPQSILCSACCRDHHDPTTQAGAKFSPRRGNASTASDPHTHHLSSLTTAVTNGPYWEACRMIRVDGIFRAAADPYNEYTNLLKTGVASGQTASFTGTAPDSTAASTYVSFVINYLKQQTNSSGVDPNTQITQTAADTLAAPSTGASLDVADVPMSQDGVARWLHARGLYLDYLEPSAKDAITKSQQTANCTSPLTLDQCLLRVLPFTSINLTELAAWTPTSGASIVVENNLFSAAVSGSTPVRGKVTAQSSGVATGSATIRTVNTGLLGDATFAINNDEIVVVGVSELQTNNKIDQPDVDTQQVTVSGPNCGRASASITFPDRVSGSTPSSTTLDTTSPTTTSPVGTCDGSSSTITTANTKIKLAFSGATSLPTTLAFRLRAPDGTNYPSSTGSVTGIGPHEFAAAGNPDASGVWTLTVLNSKNGAETITLGYSVSYIYTATFTATLSGYTTVTTTSPSGTMSPGGSCSFATGTTTNTNCFTTSAGAAAVWTLGTYNHAYTGTARNLTCGTETCSKTTYCKNYNITAATSSNTGATVDITGTVLNLGKLSEGHPISISKIDNGDTITVTFTAGTDTAPTCTGNGNNCNNYTAACP